MSNHTYRWQECHCATDLSGVCMYGPTPRKTPDEHDTNCPLYKPKSDRVKPCPPGQHLYVASDVVRCRVCTTRLSRTHTVDQLFEASSRTLVLELIACLQGWAGTYLELSGLYSTIAAKAPGAVKDPKKAREDTHAIADQLRRRAERVMEALVRADISAGRQVADSAPAATNESDFTAELIAGFIRVTSPGNPKRTFGDAFQHLNPGAAQRAAMRRFLDVIAAHLTPDEMKYILLGTPPGPESAADNEE